MTAFFAALASLATIVGGIVYFVKYIQFKTQVTPDQANQDIDAQEHKNKQEAEQSGRPV